MVEFGSFYGMDGKKKVWKKIQTGKNFEKLSLQAQ